MSINPQLTSIGIQEKDLVNLSPQIRVRRTDSDESLSSSKINYILSWIPLGKECEASPFSTDGRDLAKTFSAISSQDNFAFSMQDKARISSAISETSIPNEADSHLDFPCSPSPCNSFYEKESAIQKKLSEYFWEEPQTWIEILSQNPNEGAPADIFLRSLKETYLPNGEAIKKCNAIRCLLTFGISQNFFTPFDSDKIKTIRTLATRIEQEDLFEKMISLNEKNPNLCAFIILSYYASTDLEKTYRVLDHNERLTNLCQAMIEKINQTRELAPRTEAL